MTDLMTLDKQLCFAVYETAGEFNKLYTGALQEFGLTYPQYLVLLSLWEKDGVAAKDLGASLRIGTGTLTPMINRMEANGWLRKERSKQDERKISIHLEPKAKQTKQAIAEKVAEAVGTCQIGYEEYEKLLSMLHELSEKLRNRA
ncbi:MarR family winged helix-turn-helix transcriptional regulator [Bacillus sp. 1P06AnD]|uniref:MarR family winged helix-turn-helix transcriptional regulator n=1 Tax=Bacillus sp. 1P06AnD TaxID=3132208 RepID=UPI0039A2EACB